MKKMKKVLALILAMAMVLGMGLTVFAETKTTGTVTVKGVSEEGAVVTLYQLVSYNAVDQEYVLAEAAGTAGYTIGSRDPEMIAEIASNSAILERLYSVQISTPDGSGNYVKDGLGAGTYLVLVTNAGATIYNPMLVSLEVEYPDGVGDGEVDADSGYVVNDQTVYAKSTTEIKVDKVIVDESGKVIGTNGKYDDVYAGTEVYFEITGTIPSYSEQYDNNSLTYTITDTLGEGLDLVENQNDYSGDHDATKKRIEEQLEDNAAVVTVNKEDKIITIAFNKQYILEHGNKEIKLTYPAVLTGDASNFDPATNTVTVQYSNSPSATTSGTPSSTNHYTFDLESELVKVDSEDNTDKLVGAEFSLKDGDGTVVGTAVSDENGLIKFEGLDQGIYTLEETKAPEGYQLSGKSYTVIISAEYGSDNLLSKYTVTIKDGDREIGKMEYTANNKEGTGAAANIPNTTLSTLPSTGGIGTTIFTVGGCIIMIAAAALFFMNRRKSEE